MWCKSKKSTRPAHVQNRQAIPQINLRVDDDERRKGKLQNLQRIDGVKESDFLQTVEAMIIGEEDAIISNKPVRYTLNTGCDQSSLRNNDESRKSLINQREVDPSTPERSSEPSLEEQIPEPPTTIMSTQQYPSNISYGTNKLSQL